MLYYKVIKEDVTVVVFVDRDVEEKDVKVLKAKIEQLDNIADLKYRIFLEVHYLYLLFFLVILRFYFRLNLNLLRYFLDF